MQQQEQQADEQQFAPSDVKLQRLCANCCISKAHQQS